MRMTVLSWRGGSVKSGRCASSRDCLNGESRNAVKSLPSRFGFGGKTFSAFLYFWCESQIWKPRKRDKRVLRVCRFFPEDICSGDTAGKYVSLSRLSYRECPVNNTLTLIFNVDSLVDTYLCGICALQSVNMHSCCFTCIFHLWLCSISMTATG